MILTLQKFLQKKYVLGAAATLLVAGLLVWWLMPAKMPAESRYVTAGIERGEITQTVSANGTLNPVTLVNVGSQVSGIVKKIYADFNDRVKAGQILLELDPALIEAQLQQSTANVENARASLELAQANEARTRGLYAQEYVTRLELDQSVQALKSARAQLAVYEAQAKRDRTNLSYTVIRSPVSGVVVSREVNTGQTVAASFQTPTLFKIAQNLSKMQIDTSYAEADVGSIHVGQLANFRVDAFPNRSFHGKVHQVRLNPTTQQNVVTYNVVVSVDNTDQSLLPGMTAYVNIIIAQSKGVVMVPNAALRFRPADKSRANNKPQEVRQEGKQDERKQERSKTDAAPMGTVYVLENGQPKAIKVAIGITDNRNTEVLSGDLKEGAIVILEDRQASTKKSGSSGLRLF
ncbi:MAG: efflux transporter periplasmic adaptor subunit [Gallionellales bacterium 35-53-114]|nr:MAG: efflux transporter periplasmic adaptor subunit [Gallionellales bacterium 35-53-114]OYZ62983.1 MAG: efflux transporter periplasmic adaptor subunit [Gallionellales bacterium 24-53-125]OZB09068.1 MAG: efflux transporter periplasmic adaptor subunit [Gallionellales bacterium 39-52-133]HQS59281.1 efflux RND transporter periplasmic adaptor subunit [Gallionellaceae bacterium]HQS76194.1 efflux RND transporter periplasmic adaptor subunit [Gallionellaceae bacterium]